MTHAASASASDMAATVLGAARAGCSLGLHTIDTEAGVAPIPAPKDVAAGPPQNQQHVEAHQRTCTAVAGVALQTCCIVPPPRVRAPCRTATPLTNTKPPDEEPESTTLPTLPTELTGFAETKVWHFAPCTGEKSCEGPQSTRQKGRFWAFHTELSPFFHKNKKNIPMLPPVSSIFPESAHF